MKELTIQDIEAIIHHDESRILEVKKTTGELYAGMQSGCAFLNTEGGWLFFGVHPTTLKILGQDVVDKTRQEIAWELYKFSPAIDLAAQYIDVPGRPDKKVIAVLFPAPVPFTAPYTYDGRPYYKVENTTKPMPRDMFDERIRLSDPKKFSWEMAPCPDATIRDIDSKTLKTAIDEGISKGRIPADAAAAKTTVDRLRPFKVLTQGNIITNGAIALFGKAPSRFFDHCKVRLARFEGTIMDKFRDQAVVETNLFQQLQAIEDFCRKHMFMSGNQDDFDSKNELTVPIKVIREASLNLLAHRTWWSEARTPSVAIFDDRIEFMNPGAFPMGTSPDEFRRHPHSEPINEKIASTLFKGGKAEGWGRGILNMFTYCKEAGLPEPEYAFVTNFVSLTIRFKTQLAPYLTNQGNISSNERLNERLSERLNSSLLGTLALIKANPGIQRKEIVAETGKGDATIGRHLVSLVEKGLIEHRGSKKTGGYYAK